MIADRPPEEIQTDQTITGISMGMEGDGSVPQTRRILPIDEGLFL
jgi:hypothetical protein